MITKDDVFKVIDPRAEYLTKDDSGKVCWHILKPEPDMIRWNQYWWSAGEGGEFGYIELEEFQGKEWFECIVKKVKTDLYNGDCLSIMDNIEDKSIDMICCDLPYGVTQNKKDVSLPFDKLWEQYERIIKDNGVITLFGQGLFYVDLVNSNRKLFRYDLVWDKVLTSGFLNANRMPLRRHEQIAVFYKTLPTYNPQYTEGKPLHGKGISYLEKEFKNQNYGHFNATEDSRKGTTKKYPSSILKFSKPHPSVAKHRTEKSIECLEWLIKTYTNEGDTVLDNCMGAGSCGVASINNNRNFIGIELDEKYFEIAKRRIKNEY